MSLAPRSCLAALVLALGLAACSPPPPAAATIDSSTTTVVKKPMVAQVTDPCADYRQLEAGHGNPARQTVFNHLDARRYARWRMACVYRWGAGEWSCLEQLWNEEHGWQTSGDGIPQARPRSKMAAAGADWRTNPRTQIRWGLAYIAGRYQRPTRASLRGRPCHAGY